MSVQTKRRLAWIGVGLLVILALILTQRPDITFGIPGLGISLWVVLAAIAAVEAVYIHATPPK